MPRRRLLRRNHAPILAGATSAAGGAGAWQRNRRRGARHVRRRINSLCIEPVRQQLISTACTGGEVKVWDVRFLREPLATAGALDCSCSGPVVRRACACVRTLHLFGHLGTTCRAAAKCKRRQMHRCTNMPTACMRAPLVRRLQVLVPHTPKPRSGDDCPSHATLLTRAFVRPCRMHAWTQDPRSSTRWSTRRAWATRPRGPPMDHRYASHS